ncbi:hypothetical protein ACJX0J_008291, partial [Zea mays]
MLHPIYKKNIKSLLVRYRSINLALVISPQIFGDLTYFSPYRWSTSNKILIINDLKVMPGNGNWQFVEIQKGLEMDYKEIYLEIEQGDLFLSFDSTVVLHLRFLLFVFANLLDEFWSLPIGWIKEIRAAEDPEFETFYR